MTSVETSSARVRVAEHLGGLLVAGRRRSLDDSLELGDLACINGLLNE
jgi:hypothetical protein